MRIFKQFKNWILNSFKNEILIETIKLETGVVCKHYFNKFTNRIIIKVYEK